jgi:hypothetical protein
MKSPHAVQEPGCPVTSDAKFRHQDSLGHIFEGSSDDRFLDPTDGAVKELMVQRRQDIQRTQELYIQKDFHSKCCANNPEDCHLAIVPSPK